MASTAGRYRKVFMRIWTERNFQRLPERDRLVTLYLLTGPQTNRLGLYRLSMAQGAEDFSGGDIALTPGEFCTSVRHVMATFGWQFDEEGRVLWIPTWWRYNAPENANVLKCALKELPELPDTSLLLAFAGSVEHLPANLHTLFRRSVAGFLATKGSGNVSQTFAERSGNVPETRTEAGTGTGAPQEAGYTLDPPESRGTSREIAPGDPHVRQLLDRYQQRWRDLYHAPASMTWKRDTAIAKRLLDEIPFDEALALLDTYFDCNDPYYADNGHPWPMFPRTINKLRAKRQHPRVSAATVTNLAAARRVLERHSTGGR